MKEMGHLRVSMVESNLQELDLESKTYSEAVQTLRDQRLQVLYESRTSVLTPFQRELYEKAVRRAPKVIGLLLDPIVVAFAIHDACDLSGYDYIWLDLEGEDEIGNCAWVRSGEIQILDLAGVLLRKHLEKYVLDAYDRQTRDDMVRVWEAQLKLLACSVCGESSLDRKPILTNGHVIRSWMCSGCGHHVTVQADVIRYLQSNGALKSERVLGGQ